MIQNMITTWSTKIGFFFIVGFRFFNKFVWLAALSRKNLMSCFCCIQSKNDQKRWFETGQWSHEIESEPIVELWQLKRCIHSNLTTWVWSTDLAFTQRSWTASVVLLINWKSLMWKSFQKRLNKYNDFVDWNDIDWFCKFVDKNPR